MKVALFATCLGDQFFAKALADAVRLLRSLDVDVEFPPDQTCCGQPAFNSGHWTEARRMARHTLKAFAGTDYVVLPSGSCTAMVRAHYGQVLAATGTGRRDDSGAGGAGAAPDAGDASDAAEAAALARRTYELAEFLAEVLGIRSVGTGLAGRRIAFHHGCHGLRELGLEAPGPMLLRGAGAEVVDYEAARECCGFGGLFSVKLPEVSAAMADRKLDALPDADVLTSADPGCLLHLAGRLANRGIDVPVVHLASLLWEARNGD